ncbi:exported hypothetical protein [Mesorhizobium escarrei]|uniref:Uncharacterized protein n=2 Tax=Mesorhizobium escarrei TaxID=666018 RepID=A0ABM9EHH5_9HYPH|nr:exported hypothetical protein [Mesorhizobium escarrei]
MLYRRNHHSLQKMRHPFLSVIAICAAAALSAPSAALAQTAPYADPAKPALKKGSMVLDPSRAALVVQNGSMDPKGKAWPVVGETEQQLIPHLDQLFAAAKAAGMVVASSPQHYYHWNHEWQVQGPLEVFQHEVGIFDRKGPYTLSAQQMRLVFGNARVTARFNSGRDIGGSE